MGVDIWVPNDSPDTITIYVDETLFDSGSGLIHVGLPVPDAGNHEFQIAVTRIRAELPRFRRTGFKAQSLNASNASAYARFLKYVINLLGLIGDGSELRGVVTVEGKGRSAGWERQFILNTVNQIFANLRIETRIGPEFARHAGWLRRNFDYLCPTPIAHQFRFVADGKYGDVPECNSLKPTYSPSLGAVLWWEHWKHLTVVLNSVLARARRGRWVPHFTEFRFDKDDTSVYLQAADLLANLFFNALKFEKGIHTENTRLKSDLLRTVHENGFEARPLDALEVVPRTDLKGEVHEQLVLKDEQFSGRLTLSPYKVFMADRE